MNNSIKKFKEEIENIQIPEKELQTRIQITINKTNNKRIELKRFAYVSSTAVIILTLLLGSGFVSPVMAEMLSKIPYLRSVLPYTDSGLEVANEKGLVESIGQTANDKGIPITITDVYFDNNRLEVGYMISLENTDEKDLEGIDILGISKADLLINGNDIDYTSSAEFNEDYVTGTISATEIDLKNLSNTVELKINVTEALGKSGEWIFDLNVEKNEESKIINIEKSVETDVYKFSVNKMEVTPSTTKFEYAFEIPASLKDFNEVALTFNLYNEKGEKFEVIKSGVILHERTKEKTRFSSEVYFKPIADNTKGLSIVPVIMDESGNSKILTDLKMELTTK
ncbi:DUF4179 domain-containing protein [Peribacillus frigoritolerans]|uniref:DUF4179 domain-containing protein n=1 Tax=Peribacillus frigoritolerans TaxID=450367 RepID=UPI002162A46E|nr:DUF4179 domain-containing protein [Peribacillus frigoritolerans]